MKTKDDIELFAGMALGDYDSFTELYFRYIKSLTHYGLKFTTDINIVRDCLHDIFVSLWSRRTHIKIESSVKSYLVKSVRSSVLQKVNRNRKVVSFAGEDEQYDFELSISPEQNFLNIESNRQVVESVAKLLLKLTPKQREVIYLRYYQDLSFDEIAAHLNL